MLTPKVFVCQPISKLRSNLALANLLAPNNKSQIYYCGQTSLQNAAVFLTPLRGNIYFAYLNKLYS